jgi:hypothetical protein
MSGDSFIACSKCGKRLIERKRNGLFHFLFGKPSKDGSEFIPVEIFIQGNIKIKCLRRTCGAWNVLTYLPLAFQSEDTSEQANCAGKVEKKVNKQ